MPYNSVADTFYTKKLYSRLSSGEVRFYTKNGRFAFLTSFGGLGETYNDHHRLIRKRIVDFLLVLIELLVGVTADALRTSIGSKSAISLQRARLTQNFR